MDTKWPAIALQSVFLAANTAFLLAGQKNAFILASVTILVFIFAIQALSKNERFWWLFPMRFPERIRTCAIDTWILRGLILLAILFFYTGATNLYKFSILILVIGIGFPLVWDNLIHDFNEQMIAKIVKKGQKKISPAIGARTTLVLFDEKGNVIWKIP